MRTRAWRPWLFATGALVGASLLGAPSALAQGSHLKCYAITDPLPAGERDVTLANAIDNETCTIATPARSFCTETVKNGETDSNGAAGAFLCYRAVRCSAAPEASLQLSDQFGADREAEITEDTQVRWVCAPARIGD